MAQVYVKYNPYRLETTVKVNGRDVSTDSILYKVTKGKRLQEWIGKFPKMLREELNTLDFSLEYCGMALDWDDFEDAFEQAQKEGIIKVSNMKYIAGKSDEDINEKIVKVFQDLQEGPLDDFRDAKLTKAFENTNNAIFPVNVIATMSSGKSTLINALLGKKLMPSKNEACTATITEILDADDPTFAAVVYDEDDVVLQEVPHLTYEIMNELNDNPNVHRISTEGDIPFLDSKSTALMLVDTPGPNNSQNQAHKNTTYRAINNDSNNLILYVLNGTQLSTNDDAALLHYVADQIKKGGKQVRDRFLFVINKMDQFNPQEESIEKAILSAKRYLASYGIDDPQLFPCSAFTALNIKTDLAGIDIDNLTRAQERQLPISARDHILIDHGTKLPVFQTKGFQNFFSGFDHGQIRIIQLTTIYLVVVFIQQSVIVAILTGLHRQDSVPTDFPCGFITHDFRLCHIGCAVTLHDFCELADVEHIVTNLGMVLVDEFAGLYDGFIGIMNLDTATVRNTEQVLIVAVNKSDLLTVRVILIPHLRFPPLSNSMLNLIFPSSNTSI